MSARKLFYLHVPKTGGQTLATRLASAFLPDESVILKHEFGPDQRGEFLDLIAAKSFVEAHVGGELLEGVSGLDIVATVRDPVSQMISNYRHLRREPTNRWRRAALRLSPEAFFEQFGDFFTNHQTRYILSAFAPVGFEIEKLGMTRAFHARFFEALDKIRWLVPTESIDEFTRLWALETKYPVADFAATVNAAESDDIAVSRLRTFLSDRPRLYAYDTLLHQVACEAFAKYRDHVHQSVSPWSHPAHSRRAYVDQETGVWLVKNWGAPEFHRQVLHWWSGPTTQSEIWVRRRADQQFLCFDVNVVNGVRPDQIEVYSGEAFRKLDVRVVSRSDCLTVLGVPLGDLGEEPRLRVLVPDCMASIMTTATDDDLIRRSFLTSNWRLQPGAPQ